MQGGVSSSRRTEEAGGGPGGGFEVTFTGPDEAVLAFLEESRLAKRAFRSFSFTLPSLALTSAGVSLALTTVAVFTALARCSVRFFKCNSSSSEKRFLETAGLLGDGGLILEEC